MTMPKMHNGTNWDTIGKSGRDGQTVLSGSGAPAVGLGKINDFYIDKSVWNIYGPKTSGGWGSATSLIGAPSSLYDANTILAANADNTPLALTVPAATLLGRGSAGNIAALSPTTVRTDFDLAQASRVGNLLTANQASGTDTLGDTTGFVPSGGATLASTTVSPIHGARSLTMTCNASGACGVYTGTGSTSPLVSPGQLLTITAAVIGVAGETGALVITPLTSVGGATGDSAIFGPTFTLTGSLQTVSAQIQLPSTSVIARAQGYVRRATGAAGSVWTLDCLGMWVGAGGDWAMPGTPITNLGTKISRPNIDDILVQKWDSGLSRWQTIHYDSGWRDVASLLVNGWALSSGALQWKKLDSTIYLRVRGLNADAAVGDTFLFNSALTASRPSNSATMNLGWLATSVGGTAGVAAYYSTGTSGYAIPRSGITNANGLLIWDTDQGIPTSLPGTLLSQAPA